VRGQTIRIGADGIAAAGDTTRGEIEPAIAAAPLDGATQLDQPAKNQSLALY